MRPENILALLGRPSTDATIVNMLQTYGAKKYRPTLDKDDPEAITDWFPVSDLGIEFGFKDEAFLKGWDSVLRRKQPLIFYEVIYYGEHPQMAAFQDELPFELEWRDSRTVAQEKIGRFHRPMRSYLRDVWEFLEYRLTVSYVPDESAIADIIIYIPDAPWQAPVDSFYPLPSLTLVTALFGKSPYTREFERVFRPFGVMYHLDALDVGHIIDVREEFGFELHFAEVPLTPNVDGRKERVLASITLYRERDIDARGWRGELPFGIEWDDAPPIVLAKVGSLPVKKFEDRMSGSMFWNFVNFSLQVMYSTFDNLVYRVTVSWPSK